MRQHMFFYRHTIYYHIALPEAIKNPIYMFNLLHILKD